MNFIRSLIQVALLLSIGVTSISGQNWTWMKGSDTKEQLPNYGTKGVATSSNTPGSRYLPNEWVDQDGNLWLFGGYGKVSGGHSEYNDLWKYDIATNNWTWVGGSNGFSQRGTYGTKGTASVSNFPGARHGSATWVDTDGYLWLFGGFGFPKELVAGYLNDLWKYNISTGYWTWMGGDNTINNAGTYGNKGVGSTANMPGGRNEVKANIDQAGNVWLFGGFGFSNSSTGYLNDLWKYEDSSGKWTWMSGYKFGSTKGTYGTKGVAAASNVPGTRHGMVSWLDADGHYWIFGGQGYDQYQSGVGKLNDLWKYDVSTGYWTWMSGSNNDGQTGTYGSAGIEASTNIPGARTRPTTFQTSDKYLWLFGGYGKDSNGSSGALGDLWTYNINTGNWIFIKGLTTYDVGGQSADYGTKGTESSSNLPGHRYASAGWVDKDQYFWLFGGHGTDKTATSGWLNDLWVYKPDQSTLYTNNASELTGLIYGEGRWGDFDNDGDLDLLVTGSAGASALGSFNHIYKNTNGNFTSTEPTHSWQQYHKNSSTDWGDVDNDGDLDLVIMGGGAGYSAIYKNIENGTGHWLNQKLIELNNGSARFGDYDNDGDLDLYMFGTKDANTSSTAYQFYQNTNGEFTAVTIAASAMESASRTTLEWGDYDNDGDLDFLQCGYGSGQNNAVLYENVNGSFSGLVLDNSDNTHGIFIDYNNDGDLDIVISGNTETNLYDNQNGIFTKVNNTFLVDGNSFAIRNGGLATGDYDNDGDLDIAINGETFVNSSNTGSKVTFFRNEYGNFKKDFTAAGGERGNIEFGDYDNDGDLDYFWLGSLKSKIVNNTSNKSNTAPTAPSGLSVSKTDSSLTFSWSKGTDTETPQKALTYNLRIGTSSGGVEIMSPMSDVSNGKRLVPKRGNVDFNTSWTIKGLLNNTYYWSVQSVDNGYAGSSWATEQTYLRVDAPSVTITSTVSNPSNSSPIPVAISFSIAVTGFELGDISITNGTGSDFSGSDKNYTLNVTPTSDGNVTVSIPANAAVNNSIGNTASNELTITYDKTLPTITSIAPPDDTTGISLSTNLIMNFSELVRTDTGYVKIYQATDDGLVESFKLPSNRVTGDSSTQITIDPTNLLPKEKALYVQIDSLAIKDPAGNKYSGIYNKTSWTFSTADTSGPTVTLASTLSFPTTTSPVPLTITFNEKATGFAIGDITVTNGTALNLTGSDKLYSVDIYPKHKGEVKVTIAAESVSDEYGNKNELAKDYTFDFNQTVAAAEYFVDTDPGEGNGTSLSAEDGNFNGSTEDISLSLNTSSLGIGTHYIYIRYKDNGGNWTKPRGLMFNIVNPEIAQTAYIKSAEAFINTDPGFGKGTVLSAKDGTYNSAEESVTGSLAITNDLSHGDHTIFVRSKTSHGNWGEFESKSVSIVDETRSTITISSTISSPTNINTIPIKVNFGEIVTEFVSTDIQLTNGTLSNFVSQDSVYTFDIAVQADGYVKVDIAENSATDLGGNKSYAANTFEIYYDSTSPSTPLNLAGVNGDLFNTISWSSSADGDVIKYYLYSDTTNGFTADTTKLLATITNPDTQYTHTDLINFKTYYYRLSAVDSSGNESGLASQISSTPHKKFLTVDNTGQGNYVSIQSALNIAGDGDTIIVNPGTYAESLSIKTTKIIFGSKIITTGDSTYRDNTIIKGDLSTSYLDSTSIISGFTLKGGRLQINAGAPQLSHLMIRDYPSPAALYIYNKSNVTASSIVVRNNGNTSQSSEGGGVYINGSTVNFTDVVIDSNKTLSYGGGLYSTRSKLTFNKVNIIGNISSDYGGGIYSENDTSITITNSTISSDSATYGGGIYIKDESELDPILTLKNVVINNNRSVADGGGILSQNVGLIIHNSSIINNKSGGGGGGIFFGRNQGNTTDQDTLVIKRTIIKGNSTSGSGGIHINRDYGGTYLSNVLIAENISSNTGGLYHYGNSNSNFIMVNCTVALNESVDYGGVQFENGGIYNVTNTIIWNNIGKSFKSSGTTTVTNSNIQDYDIGGTNLNTDPHFIDMYGSNYRLNDSSPSINTGTSVEAPIIDLDGYSRPFPAGSNPDMGAYENARSTRIKENTYYVDVNGKDNNGGGINDPLLTINRAMEKAYHEDRIIVNPGTYEENIYIKQNQVVMGSKILSTGNSIYRDSTIIKGNVTITNVDSTVKFTGFTLKESQLIIDGGAPQLTHLMIRDYSSPQALYILNKANVTASSLVVRNNGFQDGETGPTTAGGGVKIVNSTVRFTDVVIDSNKTPYYGGGLYSTFSKLTFNKVNIIGNFSNGYGGGIYSENDTSITITNSTISGDSASIGGGGIYITEVSLNPILTLKNVIINDNRAFGENGGGIFAENVGLIIHNSSILNNRANNMGGGIYFFQDRSISDDRDSLHIEGSIIKGNNTKDSGGGININRYAGSSYMKNVLLVENSLTDNSTNTGALTGYGGGLYHDGVDNATLLTMINCTISNNTAYYACGLHLDNGHVDLINTIVYHNQGSDDGLIISAGTQNFKYNDLPHQVTGTGNISKDPLFVDMSNSNYSLQNESPCINTGHPDLDGDGVTWEQDTDDQDLDGSRLDMGSAEFHQIEFVPPTVSFKIFTADTKFGSGTTKTLQWDANDDSGIRWVKLFYSISDSTQFIDIDSLYRNPTEYSWIVPLNVSDSYRLRVQVSDPTGNTASDTVTFKVFDATKPVITVITPTSSSVVNEYEKLNVNWTVTDNHILDSTFVYYSSDTLQTFAKMDSLIADSTNTEFLIPAGATQKASVKIVSRDKAGNNGEILSDYFKIRDNTPPDIQLNSFSKNELNLGTIVNINWSSSDNVACTNVSLYYSTDSGDNWNTIIGNIPNTGYYDWLVNNDPSDNVSLRVIGYDAVALADTSEISGLKIMISYPTLLSVTPKKDVLWKTNSFNLKFDQRLDEASINSQIITLSSKANNINEPSIIFPYFTYTPSYFSDDRIINLKFENGLASFDSVTLTILEGIKSIYGYGFDADGDGIPGGIYKDTITTTLLGDYNFDSKIDVVDLAQLITVLNDNAVDQELGPTLGDEAPHFITMTDDTLDIEDVMAFVRVWNWYVSSTSSQMGRWIASGESTGMEYDHTGITFGLLDNAVAAEVQITSLDGEVKYLSGGNDQSIELSFFDKEEKLFTHLLQVNNTDKFKIPIKIFAKRANLEVSYRLVNSVGDIISQSTNIITVENIPDQFELLENYPNPFNPQTVIEYSLPLEVPVKLIVYDILGREVIRLVDEIQKPGYKSIIWNGQDMHNIKVGSGIYFYQLSANNFMKTRKMVFMK